MWQRGETIVVQEVWRGRLWSARPVVVVEDSPERLIHWCPRGTGWKVATTPPTRPRLPDRGERFAESLERMDWELGDFEWQIPSLEFVRPGEWAAVRVLQGQSGEHRAWYVNLQEPFRRCAGGIQMMDMMLDVVVEPDRTWWWKDEDEFALMVRRELISEETAACVRDAGTAKIASVAERIEPFDQQWLDFRPEPEWPLPELPVGWEAID